LNYLSKAETMKRINIKLVAKFMLYLVNGAL